MAHYECRECGQFLGTCDCAHKREQVLLRKHPKIKQARHHRRVLNQRADIERKIRDMQKSLFKAIDFFKEHDENGDTRIKSDSSS